MKKLALIYIALAFLNSESEARAVKDDIKSLANANGYYPTDRVILAIERASKVYNINALNLTAIAILETGLGKYSKTRMNNNGTIDKGLFQINSVNFPKCVEYNLDSPEGSSLCAAKLIHDLKRERPTDYLGAYHSKSPKKKEQYLNKINLVLNN